MRQEAFGHMNLRPDEFYRMRIEDFRLMHTGFVGRLQYEEGLLRKQTAMIAESMIGKGEGIKFVLTNWKIGTETNKSDRLLERVKAKRKKHRESEALKKHRKNG